MKRLKIKNVFHFGDRKSVLALEANGGNDLITAGSYVIEGPLCRQAVHVEGEMLIRGRGRKGECSVSVSEQVNLPSGVPDGDVFLTPTYLR